MILRTLNKQKYLKWGSLMKINKVFQDTVLTPSCFIPLWNTVSVLQIRSATASVNPKIQKQEKLNSPSESVSEKDFLVKLKNDPDSFGSELSHYDILEERDPEKELFVEARTLPSQKLNTKKYADIIKSLIKQRKLKEAIDILEVKMLKEDQFQPENYIYNLLLGACGRVGYTKKVFSLYNNMKKRGLKVTGGTYTALFNACANSPYPTTDGLEKAKHLRSIMLEKMYEPNDSNYNAMIKAFGRCGDLSTAFSIVDEMISKKFRIKEETLNFLLQACITDKESGFRHALLVWRKMIKWRIRPSLFTYNLMLRSLRDCHLGDIEITQDVISRIINKEQILLDQNSNKLILNGTSEKLLLPKTENASSSSNQLQLSSTEHNFYPNLMAKIPHLGNMMSLSEVKNPEDRLLLVGGMGGFLENMRENGCEPDIKTYTQLLDVIPSTLAAENQLLSMMKKSKVKIDVDFFNMLIKKRSMRFDYDSAKDVIKLMGKYNLRPNLLTYGILALGCKNKDEALSLIAEMSEFKYRLNAAILGAMLQQACFHKKIPYVLEIMEICIRENIQPNKKFIEHLDNFKKTCRKIIKNKDDKLGQSKYFQNGFQIFRMRYKMWLTEVKMDDSENVHPWQQFNESTDPNSDKYFKDKDETNRFKPRHTSVFGVKTSAKHFSNKSK